MLGPDDDLGPLLNGPNKSVGLKCLTRLGPLVLSKKRHVKLQVSISHIHVLVTTSLHLCKTWDFYSITFQINLCAKKTEKENIAFA